MTSSNLRDFTIQSSKSYNDELEKQFYSSSLLKRGKNKITIVESLSNLQLMINKRIASTVPINIYEFCDKKKKENDISIRIALLCVGNELLARHTLSLTELTFYFCRSRLNYLLSLELENKYPEEILMASQFYKVLKKLIASTSLFKLNNNGGVDVTCLSSDSTYRVLIHSVEQTCFNYFNLVVIPVPSLKGH